MPTFFWTDIESSTRLWQEHGEKMTQVLAQHDAILQATIQELGGKIIKHTGDGFFSIFENRQALACAIQAQSMLMKQDWGEIGEIRVRMALHHGVAEQRGGDYFGPEVNRTARILSAGWGGQILISAQALKSVDMLPETTLEDLGAHMLKDLEQPQHLYAVHHPTLPAMTFPPLRSLSSRPNNLPPQATPFIGRAEEVQAICQYLHNPDCRLLTLVGSGGAGKTRLALQSAATLIEDFPDGVYLVPLAPLESPLWLSAAIAEALHFTFYTNKDPERQLARYLEDKHLLLVMDNFEHVLTAAPLVGELLQAAPNCKVLATSRERLHLQGEHVLKIQGLSTEQEDDSDVLRLFQQSARRVLPDFRLQPENLSTVRAICRLVDGLPLGIELAASWMNVLSCEQILSELQANLDAIESRKQDIPERHRGLRQVFEYSWQLLTDEERAALQALSAFPGSFTLEVAREGVGLPLTLLASLVEKSLVQKGNQNRYYILNTVRGYAQEKGGIAQATRQRLCRYYANWMQVQSEALQTNGQQQALRLVGEEIHNLRTFWGWIIAESHFEHMEAFAIGLYYFYNIQAWYKEGHTTFREAVNALQRHRPPTRDLDETRRRVLGRMLAYWAAFEIHLRHLQEAEIRLKKSLQLARSIGHAGLMGFALDKLGRIADARGDYQAASEYYAQALQYYESSHDEPGIAMALDHIGYAHYRMAQFGPAQEYFTRALTYYQRLQNEWGIATCVNNLGNIAYMLGDYFTAQQHYTTSRGLRKAIGDQHGYATTCINLGLLMRTQGDFEKARHYVQEAANTFAAIGDQRGLGRAWMTQGEITRVQHDFAQARQLLKRSISTLESQEDHNNAAFARLELAHVDTLEGNLDRAHALLNQALPFFQRATNRYGEGLTLVRLGHLYLQKNHYEMARRMLLQALDLAEETQAATLIHESVINAARWLYATGDSQRALVTLQAWQQYTKDLPESELERKQVVQQILADRQHTSKMDEAPTIPFPRSTAAQIEFLRSLLVVE